MNNFYKPLPDFLTIKKSIEEGDELTAKYTFYTP